MNTRAIAAGLLLKVLQDKNSLTEVLQSTHLQTLAVRDQSLVRDLCFGTLRWHERLSAILAQMLSKPLKIADRDIECILRLGLYQLIYQRTPAHASVNESVNATRELKKPWAGSLVNGVLRRFIRERDEVLARVDQIPSARYACPAWLLKRIQQAWPNDWEVILTASNEHPPFTIRVNPRHYSAADYQTLLAAQAIQTYTFDDAPQALRLEPPVAVSQLPDFYQGAASVQDAAAQWAAHLLNCQTGDYVLDACAAPGGKTGHLLETADRLEILALDSSAKRLTQVQANLERLQTQARLLTADAGDLAQWWDGRLFDRILLDAPCSATGVIRRHPDIKYLRQERDIVFLKKEQARLLTALWSTLKSGGRLLYATCSILPDENIEQIKAFLAQHVDAKLIPISTHEGYSTEWGWQLLPSHNHGDGFYYALLHKQ